MTSSLSVPVKVARLYGKSPADFAYLTQVQNTIFTFHCGGESCVLRFTPETHRSFEQVSAELEWLQYLQHAGVPFAAPVPAADGSLAHLVKWEGKRYTAGAFVKAPGEIGQKAYWNPVTFHHWGNVMGKLHRASTKYHPTGRRRNDWTEQLPSDPREAEDEIVAQAKLRELVSKLHDRPRAEGSFGLIHSDLHFWNFAMDEHGPTVFDFDNSEYHWFLADVGTAIFEASTCIHQQQPRQDFIISFLNAFLDGYLKVHDLSETLIDLPDFVKLREIQIFLILSARWRGRELGPFQQSFFSAIRDAVLHDKPFIEASTMKAILNG